MNTGHNNGPGAHQPTPAGWYPVADGTRRYWDGGQWTNHVSGGPGPGVAQEQVPFQQAYMVGARSDVTNDDRQMATLAHALTLVAGFLAPLIIWITKKGESAFVDEHTKEALNFQLTMLIGWMIAVISAVVLIGFLFMPVLIVVQYLFPILAAIAANRGEYYQYPLNIRMIK